MSVVSYSAEVIGKVENRPGTWNSIRVGVFRSEGEKREQVGEYVRNYPNLFGTFFHFKKDDRDFALYSRDYTGTRIMELPSCKDSGGEEPHQNGFCPVEFYVPSYVERESHFPGKIMKYRVNQPGGDALERRVEKSIIRDEETGKDVFVDRPDVPVTPLMFYPFGFVAGCGWGDDSTWKVQYLDLSKAEEGILKRDERFGYIALPRDVKLKDAVRMGDYNPDAHEDWSHQFTIALQKRFDLRTGKEIDLLDC